MRSPPDLPAVFAYLDYRAFLKDWFEAKKAANPRYSHRAFVRRTGQRSPSFLADLLARRRNLSAQALDGVAAALGLDTDEMGFFAALVDLDQAETAEQKNAAWDRISATRRFRDARRIEGGAFRYLSRWYFPAIRELVALPGFREDPEWIARTLQPPIRPAEAAEALELLQELGMLVRSTPEGRLEPRDVRLVTPHEVQALAVLNYHQGMLKLAHDAIPRFKAADRHFLAVTAHVPRALVPHLKRELNSMYEKILEIVDGAEGPRDEVVQVHLHVFPLSAPVPAPEEG